MFGSGTRNNKRCYLRQKLPSVHEAFTPGPITPPLSPTPENLKVSDNLMLHIVFRTFDTLRRPRDLLKSVKAFDLSKFDLRWPVLSLEPFLSHFSTFSSYFCNIPSIY